MSTYLPEHPVRPARATTATTSHRGPWSLEVPRDERLSLARAWLALGLGALLVAGVFSILLVLARTPGMNRWFPSAEFFRVALVVHVDLSVLAWFVAMAGMLWSLYGERRGLLAGRAAVALCGAGCALFALAPWTAREAPVMANYIPVLDGPVFLTGLVVFGAGVALLVGRALAAAPRLSPAPTARDAQRFGLHASVVATAIALLAFAWSWATVPRAAAGPSYFEVLFWGGGHALQFTWTLLMLVAWLWLADASGARIALSPRVAVGLMMAALLAVFLTPVAYLAHDPASVEHRTLLTWCMRLGGGVAVLPVALAAWPRRRHAVPEEARPARAALASSIVLFASGGLIGAAIQGSNVRIPAHYHGCIVGVTLALMGLVVHLLPRLGYRAPSTRWATWQPVIYGAGQLLHIVGLVWSGGYGVQRKVAGTEQVLHTGGEVAGMALMGLGGLVAIVGGLMFVWLVLGAMRAGATKGDA